MPAGNAHNKQTAKQAKAAFKARGSTHVSDSERRKLERGANLLERAKRIKDQDQRKKEWLKKRTEQEKKQGSDEQTVNLGTQLRLDKFGYKSSQFHLGNFFKTRAATTGNAKESQNEPWEHEAIDETSMLDIDPTIKPPEHTPKQQLANEDTTTINDWADFLDSSTQIERELSGVVKTSPEACQTKPRRHSFRSIPSWNSDEAFDDDDLADLDSSVQTMQQGPAMEKHSAIDGPAQDPVDDTALMPPPKFIPIAKPQSSTMGPPRMPVFRKAQTGPLRNDHKSSATHSRYTGTSMVQYGISTAELESMVADDIVLSQWTGG